MSEKTYRIKAKYIMREIAGEFLAIPLGAGDGNTSQIVILNPVSKLLWEELQKEVLGIFLEDIYNSLRNSEK